METAHLATQEFFTRYAKALLTRDMPAVIGMYAVPSLIESPSGAKLIAEPGQTLDALTSAFGRYQGVTGATHNVEVVAATDHSIWADVTWHFPALPPERYMYQLVMAEGDWRIAVLTPLEL